MKLLTMQAHVLTGYYIKCLKTIGHDSCGTDLLPLNILEPVSFLKPRAMTKNTF